MKLENQVCTLQQAKRLKELGVVQESFQSWFGDEEWRLRDNGSSAQYSQWLFVSGTVPHNNMELDHRNDLDLKPIAAAFSVAELGVMIDWLHCSIAAPYKSEQWMICFNERDFIADTLIECMTDALIYELENNLITAEEVNNRLTAA